MATVSVTTDLSTGLVDDASNVNTWQEPTGTGGTSGDNYADMKSIQDEADVYIQGTASVSGAYTTNSPERGCIITDNGTGVTLPTDGAFFVWQWWISPAALTAYSDAGMFVAIGSGSNALEIFAVGGNNVDPAPLGGWYCYPVDPRAATLFENVGSPDGTTFRWVGGGIAATQQSRGLTHYAIDATRYGRGQALVIGGTSTDADATFADISDTLQPTSVSYGIFDAIAGAYYMQGLLQIGDNTSATGECDFTDSNKVVNIRNTPAVGSGFNKIEIQNGSTTASNVSWTGCSFANLGTLNTIATTASLGNLEVVDDTAVFDVINCSFADMGTFVLGSNSTIEGTSFRRCGQITGNGAAFASCTVENATTTTNSAAVVVDDIDEFVGGSIKTTGTGHAIEVTAAAGGSWTTDTSGYRAGTSGSDVAYEKGVDANGNETIFINAASGSVSISVSGGAALPSVAVPSGSTCTVAVTGFQPTLTLTGLVANSEVRIYTAGTTTELDGVENSGTTFAYQYEYVAATTVDIVVHKADYKHIRLEDFLLGSGDASLPIQQIFDRNYSNP